MRASSRTGRIDRRGRGDPARRRRAGGTGAAQPPDGAAIFETGAGLEARLGRPDGPRLPAERATCAGCHGTDGSGGREGAAPAPPIGWSALSSPTAERPAYDAAALGRLLAEGMAPGGRTISPQMPRFRLDQATLAALVAHLVRLDVAETEGLGPATVAVRLPDGAAAQRAARDAIAAFNAAGGSYGREVVVAEPAFLDLGTAMDLLAPRMVAAENDRLAQLMREDTQLRPIAEAEEAASVAGRLDDLGPHLEELLAGGTRIVAVGPAPEALQWALDARQGGAAAGDWARATLALEKLRAASRHPRRSALMRAIAEADLSQAPAVYRYEPAGTP